MNQGLGTRGFAQRSLAEVEAQLELAARSNDIEDEELTPIRDECIYLSKQLHRLRDSLMRRLSLTP